MDAFIFDLDGVIVDNNDYHWKAWKQFLRDEEVTISLERFKQDFFGKRNDQILRALFPDKTEEEREALAAEKEALYRDIYAEDIEPVTGLVDLLERSEKQHGVATSAPQENLDFVLDELDLRDHFDATLHGGDVEQPKPDPEIYDRMADELGVAHTDCLVFEDSPPGVEAGKRAGMLVIGVLTTCSEEELDEADGYIRNFMQVDWI